MAFSAAIRRASAAVIAFGRARHVHSLAKVLSNQTLASTRRTPPPFVPWSNFSTSIATKLRSDEHLLKVVEAEIKCAEECDDHDRVEEIPEGFPFKIQDDKGTNVVTLTRTFQEQKIEVIVSMPSIVTGDEPEDTRVENQDEDGGSDNDNDKPSQLSLPLSVNIQKTGSLTLEFSCTAYADEVTIDAMSVRENKGSVDDMLAYEGPAFSDLDENLQKAFHKYLEIRGISAITTNFLHEYMINKDSREYLFWLRNLKQFFEE